MQDTPNCTAILRSKQYPSKDSVTGNAGNSSCLGSAERETAGFVGAASITLLRRRCLNIGALVGDLSQQCADLPQHLIVGGHLPVTLETTGPPPQHDDEPSKDEVTTASHNYTSHFGWGGAQIHKTQNQKGPVRWYFRAENL